MEYDKSRVEKLVETVKHLGEAEWAIWLSKAEFNGMRYGVEDQSGGIVDVPVVKGKPDFERMGWTDGEVPREAMIDLLLVVPDQNINLDDIYLVSGTVKPKLTSARYLPQESALS